MKNALTSLTIMVLSGLVVFGATTKKDLKQIDNTIYEEEVCEEVQVDSEFIDQDLYNQLDEAIRAVENTKENNTDIKINVE
jgi:hypothetical protein